MAKRFGIAYIDGEEEDDKHMLAESKQTLNPETMKNLMEERDKLAQHGEINADIRSMAPDELLNGGNVEELMGKDMEDEPHEEAAPLDILEKPSMELFKAIFADSSDEEDVNDPMEGGEVSVGPVPANAPLTEQVQAIDTTPKFSVPRPPPKIPVEYLPVEPIINLIEEEEPSFFTAKKSTLKKPVTKSQEMDIDEDKSFHPVFSTMSNLGKSKPSEAKNVGGAVFGSRRKKQKIMTRVYDSEEEIEAKAEKANDQSDEDAPARPTAADFM
jgi:hypothetical protein